MHSLKQAIVFVGPTLPRIEVGPLLPTADIAGPAGHGDIYRAAAHQPWAIVLIDGLFDQRLAVWHKEILWALSKGVRVYGAASMGALRAAELSPFGMIGVGRIFEAFVRGDLERDDEVAVAHQSSELGYLPTSEALVNIRATVDRAVETGVLDQRTRDTLVDLAAETFYPARTLAAAIERLATKRMEGTPLTRFTDWLGPGRKARIDQKRIDAEALLGRVGADMNDAAECAPPEFPFEYTEAWHEFRRVIARPRRLPL
jgi:hypothetical protein